MLSIFLTFLWCLLSPPLLPCSLLLLHCVPPHNSLSEISSFTLWIGSQVVQSSVTEQCCCCSLMASHLKRFFWDSVSSWWSGSISTDTENCCCYAQCLQFVRLAQHKCDQVYFCSDAKYRKLSKYQHVVVLRHLLSAVPPLAYHVSNSWLIYKRRELGNKKTALALFVLTKPNEEWNGESIQKW